MKNLTTEKLTLHRRPQDPKYLLAIITAAKDAKKITTEEVRIYQALVHQIQRNRDRFDRLLREKQAGQPFSERDEMFVEKYNRDRRILHTVLQRIV